jgi:hypothetical protein
MQMFLQALQFQQQQAALQQASALGGQYGFAPGGNWMTWGAGGPTQPTAGTPTQQQQLSQAALIQSALANALSTAGVTGQFARPQSTYVPGTVLTAPSTTPGLGPAYGVVNADGSVQMVSAQSLEQLAGQRGTTAQAMMQNAQPVDWNTLQSLSQGAPTGPTQQTLAAQGQTYNQALQSGQLTGMFYDPSQTPDALLQQGKAMDGTSFNSLPPEEQQFWLKWNANNPTQAAQQWARAANGALQQAGYKNPAAQGQQTLQAINQAATLSGMYNGAPTETAREFNQSQAQQLQEFNKNLALQQGQLGQQYLSTAAQLQGPQNTFQLSNYLRGAQGNPNVPVYLQSLMNNQGLAPFQATGSTAPTPQSAAGLLAQMGYGGGQGGMYPTGTTPTNASGSPADQLAARAAWSSAGPQDALTGSPQYADQNAARAAWGSAGPQDALTGSPQYADQNAARAAWGAGLRGASTNAMPGGDFTQQMQTQGAGAAYGGQQGGYNGQSATPGWDYNSTLNSINQIARRGAQGLAPGSLERLSSDELQAFGSGLGAAGYSLPSFLQQYQQSRVGQQAPIARMSLA